MTNSTSVNVDLKGKVAFVQGGSRGIGAAIVKRLAEDGAVVAFTYASSATQAQALAHEVESRGGRVLALKADSADPAVLKQAVDTAATAFGSIDILVNNAGTLVLSGIDELTLDDFERTVAINVRSVFVATQAASRYMPDGGRIINIGSTNADRMPFPGGSIYAMSKAALVGLTKGLARDLGARGITVNNVQPGPVGTDMNPLNGDFAPTLRGLTALDRFGHADEIAGFVAYLASTEAGYITGASLSVDGGFAA